MFPCRTCVVIRNRQPDFASPCKFRQLFESHQAGLIKQMRPCEQCVASRLCGADEQKVAAAHMERTSHNANAIIIITAITRSAAGCRGSAAPANVRRSLRLAQGRPVFATTSSVSGVRASECDDFCHRTGTNEPK